MQRQSTSLDYLRSSPVRGQLEPSDARTATGWRYIQTTDTLNQLKVLLPPGTASMYEQLLKFEAFELGKKSAISWERILEIRHLKDRMIRKCQKLAKASPSWKVGDALAFQTFVAPLDFRVKEMEKWFRQQQKRTNALLRRPPARGDGMGNPYCCSRCAVMERIEATRETVPFSGRSSQSNIAAPNRPPLLLTSKSATSDKRLPTHHSTRPMHQQTPLALRADRPPALLSHTKPTIATTFVRSVTSPPPLPHLLRIRDLKSGFDLSNDPQKLVSHRDEPDAIDSLSSDDSPPSPSVQQHGTPHGELRRRRSCIRRSSVGDFVKTVSWADDCDPADQSTKYLSVAREAQASGRKWEEIRDIYMQQMAGLEILHQQVRKSLEHLRSETEHLKHADETIRLQRDALRSMFGDFERKQVEFQVKVEEALEDADHMLSLAASRDDVSPDEL